MPTKVYMPKISFAEAINFAISRAMTKDKNMICYGLGVTDPKSIFGTTKNLEKKFGKKRVFDVPNSENALTGISVGLALNGVRSVVSHQRLDFFLLAFDQLINSAAKWYYMFGSKKSVPITIRLIIGRGWGQGPTHSQSLQSVFAHIPGLKVVIPSNPQNAQELLLASIFDPNPVVFLEHRWLHNLKSNVSQKKIKKLAGSNILKRGKDLTIITMSFAVMDVLDIAKRMSKESIDIEVIDLSVIKPISWNNIIKSVKKTGKMMLIDTGAYSGSISSEIISEICIKHHSILKKPPIKIAMPDFPEPTSYGLTKNFYFDKIKIVKNIKKILNIKRKLKVENEIKKPIHHDIPGKWFTGPF
jgi:pyruvate/2-oxoglutarate/acetoin dehydrogenase E1 component